MMRVVEMIGVLFYLMSASLIKVLPGKRLRPYLCVKILGGHRSQHKLEYPIKGLEKGQCKHCGHKEEVKKPKSN